VATLSFFMELDRLKTVERRNWLASGATLQKRGT